jgi:signal transduction histidine kinase/phage shock protein PspC (stress-responsive transcriptional regulator)
MAVATPLRGLRRDRRNGVLAGVCAGLGNQLGIDPLIIRIAFVVAALAGGVGIGLYLLGWMLVPAEPGDDAPALRIRTGRSAVEVALGVAFLLLSVLLAVRELGLWFSDAIVWPLVLVAAGAALIWRQSLGGRSAAAATESVEAAPPRAETHRAVVVERAALVSRTGLGIALVIGAGLVFLQTTDSLSAARDVVLAVLVVVIALAIIFAPWILRLVRSLSAERAERIRSQERAEMAAHLHDSVLQTLALVQKRAGSSRDVAALARRQERDLRAWLAGRAAPHEEAATRLVPALGQAAQEVEESHGVEVEVVAVGDCALDEAAIAVVAAAREAIVNAAKFAGGSPIDVYVEADDHRLAVFVRDRGPGFDPDAVPPDRQGIRESIVGRMERHGGQAHIRSTPASGTEIELVLEQPSQ